MPTDLTDVWAWEEEEKAPPPAPVVSARAVDSVGPLDEATTMRDEVEQLRREVLQRTSMGFVVLMCLVSLLLVQVERSAHSLRRLEAALRDRTP